jgi:biotin operon repressor
MSTAKASPHPTATAKTPRKPKSPPVPSYALQDSVEDAKKLYRQYSHGAFSKPEIASTLKMSSGSSSFSQRIFALTEYGLIVESGDGYKLTDRFRVLNSEASESAAFRQAAWDAVSASAVLGDLLNDFKTKLPDRSGVAQRLEIQKKFNSERAKGAAVVLEKSLQFAKVLDANNNIIPVRPNAAGVASAKAREMADSNDEDTDEVVDIALAKKNTRRSEVPLADGRVAIVLYPHDLSVQEAEKIGRVLAALVG